MFIEHLVYVRYIAHSGDAEVDALDAVCALRGAQLNWGDRQQVGK